MNDPRIALLAKTGHAMPGQRGTTHHGFTLIELVIVILLTGILASIVVKFITQPISGFADLSRRAQLVDIAETALTRMTRDIRNALPNSLRTTGSSTVLEFINVRDGGRYRAGPGPGTASAACRLSFTTTDTSFAVIGGLGISSIAGSDRMVISNWNNSGTTANAYAVAAPSPNITPAATTLTLNAADGTCQHPVTTVDEDYITLSAGFKFPLTSARQRFYIVDTPVTFLCDTGAGTIRRYSGYAITTNQSDVDTNAELLAAGATSVLLVDNISSCSFTYSSGSSLRSGLATLSITATRNNESVNLLQQVHVNNVP